MEGDCYLFLETLSTRLKMDIIERLKKRPLSVNELSKQLNQERSKVSHALLSLAECNFVLVEKKGKNRIYSLNKDTIVPLLDLIEEHVTKYCKVCNKVKGKK